MFWFYAIPTIICLLCFIQFCRINPLKKEGYVHFALFLTGILPFSNYLALVAYLIYFTFKSGSKK